jgi:glycerol-3-phosphate cytidylyltransferase-like family protein
MHNRIDAVKKLGKWFFAALVIDRERDTKKKVKIQDEDQKMEGTRFAEWDDEIIKSAVWRGFVKGLMSNPMIEEVWPNAFV